ncbi:putative ATP-dependent RNA helicase DHX37-like protein, partial [Leptotrombidium deliense]
AMNIDNVVNFPFPTPPSNESLLAAEKRLLLLGALKVSESNNVSKQKKTSRVTDIGKAMSFFPLNPRYSKMIVLSANQGLLCYTVALVSALTVQEIFLNLPNESEKFDKRKSLRHKWNEVGNSLLLGDFMLLLKAVGCSTFVKFSEKLIEAYGLRYKAMIEIKKLRQQLTSTVTKIFATKDIPSSLDMDPPSDSQCKFLRQIALSALLDHVAKKVDTEDLPNNQRQTCYKFIKKSMNLQTNVVAIEKEWLPIYAADLCTFSKPLESPTPRFDAASDKMLCYVTATYGPFGWSIPATEVEFPEGVEKYRWFAKCFLEGTVFNVLLQYKSALLSSPSVMVKSWAKLQPRTESLLSALYSKKCASRKRFLEILHDYDLYLLEEYCEWIPPRFTDRVRNTWKNMFLD